MELAQRLRLPSSKLRCGDIHLTNLEVNGIEVIVVTFVRGSVIIFFNRAFTLKLKIKVYLVSICFLTLFIQYPSFRRQHSRLVSRWECQLPLTIQQLLGRHHHQLRDE